MRKFDFSKEDEVLGPKNSRPHLVILGAGASYAAFPNGDKNGMKLPLMNNIVEVVGLEKELDDEGIPHKGINFETIYSQLSDSGEYPALVKKIENKVFEYFSKLELPDEPTIYDFLVAGLRKKDAIATFNWDPFLFQALKRNYGKAELPHAIYLHGSVSVGICHEGKSIGPVGHICSYSGKEYQPSKLLYPVTSKNYTNDPFTSQMWKEINSYLERAFMLTVFGYGAPSSDVEAIELFKKAWGPSATREFEEIEFIDIRSREDLEKTWEAFIHTHHFDVVDDFFKSQIAFHPRRSIEALWQRLMEANFCEGNPYPQTRNWVNFDEHVKRLVKVERDRHL
jgi:hypothetical protein